MSAANTSRDTGRRVTEGETSGNSSAEGYPHTSGRPTSEMSNDADSSSVHQSAEKISHETEHLQRVPPPEMDTDIKEALAPDLTAAAVASQTGIYSVEDYYNSNTKKREISGTTDLRSMSINAAIP